MATNVIKTPAAPATATNIPIPDAVTAIGWKPINPFEDNGRYNYAFVIDKKVQMMLLVPQIKKALGEPLPESEADVDHENQLWVSSTARWPDMDISKRNPLYLFLSSVKQIDEEIVQQVIEEHDGNELPVLGPTSGTDAPATPTDGGTATTIAVDTSNPEVVAAVQKLQDGSTLTTKEISNLLRGIVAN